MSDVEPKAGQIWKLKNYNVYVEVTSVIGSTVNFKETDKDRAIFLTYRKSKKYFKSWYRFVRNKGEFVRINKKGHVEQIDVDNKGPTNIKFEADEITLDGKPILSAKGTKSDSNSKYTINRAKYPMAAGHSIGTKADSNKRRYSLLPTGTVNEVVDVLEFGSQKYSDNNWQHVENARTRYYDACLRHIDAWFSGQINDDETGKHHLAHAVCCLLFLMWFDMGQADG